MIYLTMSLTVIFVLCCRDDPAYLRNQLKEILDEEEKVGSLNPSQRSLKKTLQRAYDAAIKRQVVR